MFIPAVGDYINAELLGNPQSLMIGNVIQARYLRVTDYPTASALSFILMAAILVGVFLYVRAARDARSYGLMAVRRAATIQEPISLGDRGIASAGADRWLLPIYVLGVTLYLVLPVVVMIAFSFNDPAGRSNLKWGSFSHRCLAGSARAAGPARGGPQQPRHRVLVDDRRDDPRDAHRARPGPLRVPRPGRHEPARSSCRCRRPRSCSARRC